MTWRLILDFETRSAVDLKTAGAWRYSEDPTTSVICLSFGVAHGSDIYRWEPIRLPEHRRKDCWALTRLKVFADRPEIVFEAHNAGFEQAIWQNIMVQKWGMPPIPPERWDDTMARALHMGLPGKLEGVAKVLGVAQKDMEGNKLLNKLSKPYKPRKNERLRDPEWDKKLWWHEDPTELERLAYYCDQDVLVERDLSNTLVELPPDEREIWELDQHINQRGVRIDLEAVRAAQKIMDDVGSRINAEVEELTGGAVKTVNQTEAMTEWVKEQCGRAPEDWRKDTVEKAMKSGGLKRDYPHVHRLMELRQQGSRSSTSKLKTMEAAACHDGRARYLLQYQGAATTGRWAGRLIQPQNFPQGSVKADGELLIDAIKTGDADFLELMYGDPAAAVSSALRPMLMADEGNELVAGDFSAIEARVVLALAEQWDKVRVLKEGHDVYCDMAETIYGYRVTKADNPDERHVGKSAVLGLGFQCGAGTFQDTFLPGKPLVFCEDIVQTYRRSWAPKVPDLWQGLESAAVDACHNNRKRSYAGIVFQMEGAWLTARLPSGRKLYYHGAGTELRKMPWDPEDERLGLYYYAQKYGKWRKVSTYGGHITENVVQAMARDIMANAMRSADRRGIPMILTVHDEVVAEPKKGRIDASGFEEIMVGSQPKWVEQWGIPVAAEAWVGKRYRK